MEQLNCSCPFHAHAPICAPMIVFVCKGGAVVALEAGENDCDVEQWKQGLLIYRRSYFFLFSENLKNMT